VVLVPYRQFWSFASLSLIFLFSISISNYIQWFNNANLNGIHASIRHIPLGYVKHTPTRVRTALRPARKKQTKTRIGKEGYRSRQITGISAYESVMKKSIQTLYDTPSSSDFCVEIFE
jgi:hypothetical protein